MNERSVQKAWESVSEVPWADAPKDQAIAFTMQFVTSMSTSLIEVARMPNYEHAADEHNATVKMFRAAP